MTAADLDHVRRRMWTMVHNCIIHPLWLVLPEGRWNRVHDKTAERMGDESMIKSADELLEAVAQRERNSRSSTGRGPWATAAPNAPSVFTATEAATHEAVERWSSDPGVRVLAPIDCDDVPHGLPPHAWLLQSWAAVQDHIDARRPCAPGGQLLDDEVRWDEAVRQAVIAHGTALATVSVLDQALDGQERISSRESFGRTFTRFVDGVISGLRRYDDCRQPLTLVQPLVGVGASGPGVARALRVLQHDHVVHVVVS